MKRKPIYILRGDDRQKVAIRGSVTLDGSRTDVKAVVDALRRIGIEASPKQPEVHR